MLRMFITAALIGASFASSASELPVASKITAVTVFPTGAEITRVAALAFEAGSHVVIVQDLPAGIEENSVRVEGDMTGGVEIVSVDSGQIFIKKPGAPDVSETERKKLERDIEKLRDERVSLDGVIEAANAQKALAQNLAKLPLSPARENAAAAPDWNGLFDLIGGRFGAFTKAILDAQVKQREIDTQILELEASLNRQPPEETERTEVKIFLEAAAPASGELRIRYRSAAAGWQPAYDARLTTGAKDASLTLTRRASVTQDTGEDWDEATLMLSTARPGGSTAAPEMRPLQVDFRPEFRYETRGRLSASPPAPAADAKQQADGDAAAPGASAPRSFARPVIQRQAVIESSIYQAQFRIPAKVTVKTGTGAKKVVISSETLKPAVKVITAPKENTAAFLNAHFTYQGEAPLLPGEAALYRDNVYIGAGALPLVAAGEEHDLGFGVDDAVKVNRISVKREKGETGILTSSNVDEQHFRITVKNLHSRPAPVLILDQMPYSEDEKIAVELLPITTQPVEINHDDKRGVLAWELTLAPGEEKTISLSYQINWPAKREVVTIPR